MQYGPGQGGERDQGQAQEEGRPQYERQRAEGDDRPDFLGL
jgi:hypothetical protein